MLRLIVNGAQAETSLPRTTPLLPFLRNDLGLNGPKFGCGLGECGSCTVLVDGLVARACVLTLAEVEGREVVTLEGLGTHEKPHLIQAAFIAAAGAQCGYCLNGMIMTAKALLDANPSPSEGEIREALRYNLCRCGAHFEIINAIKLAASDTNGHRL
jgi:nicotinate dehydrogenase subunit A